MGDFRSSLELVEEACERNLFPDMVILTALLCALCKRREMKGAGKLWHMMQDNGFVGDKFTLGSMIAGHCKDGNTQEALCLLHQMLQKGFLCDRYTSEMLVCELRRGNHFREAAGFFGLIFKNNIHVNESLHRLPYHDSDEGKMDGFYFHNRMVSEANQMASQILPGKRILI